MKVEAISTEAYVGEVYDFTIPGDETFWAERVLVHNCRQEKGDPVTRCHGVDGRQYASLDAALRDYPLGIYRSCKGTWRCRGFVWASYMGPAEAPAGGGE